MDEQVTYQEARRRAAELKREYKALRKVAWKLAPARVRWRRRAFWAFIALLPIQYVASLGPIVGLLEYGILPEPFVETWIGPLYFPLFFVGEQIPFVGDVLTRYMEWWGM